MWHSVSKMSGHYGTFVDSLCQVFFERSLNDIPFLFVQEVLNSYDVYSDDGENFAKISAPVISFVSFAKL